MENIPQPVPSTSSPTPPMEATGTPLSVSPSAIGATALIPAVKKKREDKLRRRDRRAIDNVLKSIHTADDTERLSVLSSRYTELYDEFRTSQNTLMATEKRATILQREKNQLETEQSKSILARSRMENLCRELQRQNKLIKDENITKIREEEERRKEVAAKFQATLNEVTALMQDSSEKNLKLRDDNIDMANKITALCEQFEKREEQLCRVSKQIELEKQLAEAKIAKARIEFEATKEKYVIEKELWTKEREYLTSELEKSNEKAVQLQLHVKSLQDQILLYTGKYEEFESTISRSSQVFDNCKSEISKMNKQMISVEKELKMWKGRYYVNTQTIKELAQLKDSKENQIVSLNKRLDQLTKLCRQIQTERALFLQLLRQNGIEPPKSETHVENGEATAPEIKPPQCDDENDALRKKDIQLADLKSALLAIKEQVAIAQQTETVDDPPPVDDTQETIDESRAATQE